MGASSAGVSVMTQTKDLSIDKLVTSVFGKDYLRTEEIGDIRDDEWVLVSKTKKFIHIRSAFFAANFFTEKLNDDLALINDLFDNPSLIIAFEQYSSGGTYSYAIIRDGIVNRRFRSVSYETSLDEGELEPIEIEWKNGTREEFDLGNGEKEIVISNTVNGEQCDAESIPEVVLNHILFHELKLENPEDQLVEFSFFKKTINNAEAQTESTRKPAWWKFWS